MQTGKPDEGRIRATSGSARNKQRLLSWTAAPSREQRSKFRMRAKATLSERDTEDLQRQWIQGTGPRQNRMRHWKRNSISQSIRVLSGADGWMFDGKTHWGRSRRWLWKSSKLSWPSIASGVHEGCREVAAEMKQVGEGISGTAKPSRLEEAAGLQTKIFRARDCILMIAHPSCEWRSFSATIADTVLFI